MSNIKQKNKKTIEDRIEGVIHAYAVNHYNAPEGNWGERRRVRKIAIQDLMEILAQEKKNLIEEIEKKGFIIGRREGDAFKQISKDELLQKLKNY